MGVEGEPPNHETQDGNTMWFLYGLTGNPSEGYAHPYISEL